MLHFHGLQHQQRLASPTRSPAAAWIAITLPGIGGTGDLRPRLPRPARLIGSSCVKL